MNPHGKTFFEHSLQFTIPDSSFKGLQPYVFICLEVVKEKFLLRHVFPAFWYFKKGYHND
jgi:hypothetical protein